MTSRRVINPPLAAFAAEIPLSPAVAAGPFVFTSAFGATDWSNLAGPQGGHVPSTEDPIRLETREIYQRLDEALRAGGSSLDRGVMINQWVQTYPGLVGGRDPADRDEVSLFFEYWRSIVHPHLQGRDEFLLSQRPASACMPVDRFPSKGEHVQVELVALRDEAGIDKEAFEHDIHSPLGGYSIGMVAGPWLFTAGFTGVDFVHGIRPEAKVPDFIWYGNQIYNETVETLRQLRVTVEAGGGRIQDTVKALVYLTPWAMRNLPAVDEAWRTVWPDAPPARAVIPVSGVGLRGTNVEIMLIAVRAGYGVERVVVECDRAAPALGHAAQAVKAGGLLFLSTQLAVTPQGTVPFIDAGAAAPFLRRGVRDELRLIQENVQHLCESAGTTIDQTVKAHLFFSDFADLAPALPVWGDAFTDGHPAGGFFESPPGAQQVPGCRVTADLIIAAP